MYKTLVRQPDGSWMAHMGSEDFSAVVNWAETHIPAEKECIIVQVMLHHKGVETKTEEDGKEGD